MNTRSLYLKNSENMNIMEIWIVIAKLGMCYLLLQKQHAFVWVCTKRHAEFASGGSLVGVSHSRWGGSIGNWSWWCIQVEVTGGALVMSWRRVIQQLPYNCSSGTWCLHLTCNKQRSTALFWILSQFYFITQTA